MRERKRVQEPPDSLRSFYKRLNSVDGVTVGYVCVECGRLCTSPHLPTCILGLQEPCRLDEGMGWLDKLEVKPRSLLSLEDFDRLLAVARAAEEYTRHGVQHPSWCQHSPCNCGMDKLREKLKGSSGLET